MSASPRRGRSPSPRHRSPSPRRRSPSPGGEKRERRGLYVAGFSSRTTSQELKEHFSQIGPVERVDMKIGFAFVYYKDERDGDRAIHELDRREFNRDRLRVEWARGDGVVRRREARRAREDAKPSSTLFVVNYDTTTTREADIEDLFRRYGRVVRVEMKSTFAFVQFEDIKDAMAAFNDVNNLRMGDRQLTVEYSKAPTADRASSRTPPPRRSPPRRSPPRYRDYDRDDRDRYRDDRDRYRDDRDDRDRYRDDRDRYRDDRDRYRDDRYRDDRVRDRDYDRR